MYVSQTFFYDLVVSGMIIRLSSFMKTDKSNIL